MTKVMAWFVRLAYRICAFFPSKNKITFLSRQSSRPLDFELLEPALKRAFPEYELVWACVPDSGSFGVMLALKQVWHVATSQVCFADGYIPAVCIPRSKKAYCIQMWHALGAIKRFGYQALDTSDGRSSLAAKALSMHRGYNLIVAGLPGAVPAFAQAFDCAASSIAPLGLPRIDYLLTPEYEAVRSERSQRVLASLGLAGLRSKERAVVLYAPTVRRSKQLGSEWLARSIQALYAALSQEEAILVVAGHPLQPAEESDCAGPLFLRNAPTIDALSLADYVITDYSAIAFEAALLNKKVLFYVPDIEDYRISPGLNIDPLKQCPDIAFKDAGVLAMAIGRDRIDGKMNLFGEYMDDYLGHSNPGCIDRILKYVKESVTIVSK